MSKLNDPEIYKALLSHAADDVCLAVFEYSYLCGGCKSKAAITILEEGMDEWWDCPHKNDPPSLEYKEEYLSLVQWCLQKIYYGDMDEIAKIPYPLRK